MMLLSGVVLGQQKPTTGYAHVNGLKMYYEIHGNGEPLVLLHGAFMVTSGDWNDWINELAKTRKVIAVELQGHGRTADIDRDITAENLADDVSALLDHLNIPKADILGYSLGGVVAMQFAICHPEKVRKVVSISAVIRRDGWVKEGVDALAGLTADVFKGSPMEAEYKRLSPTPNSFPDFVKHVVAMVSKPYDFGADNLKATESSVLLHPRRRGWRADRTNRRNVPIKRRRQHPRRHAPAFRFATGYFAGHHTRHANEPNDNDRPDDQRLSRCQGSETVKEISPQRYRISVARRVI